MLTHNSCQSYNLNKGWRSSPRLCDTHTFLYSHRLLWGHGGGPQGTREPWKVGKRVQRLPRDSDIGEIKWERWIDMESSYSLPTYSICFSVLQALRSQGSVSVHTQIHKISLQLHKVLVHLHYILRNIPYEKCRTKKTCRHFLFASCTGTRERIKLCILRSGRYEVAWKTCMDTPDSRVYSLGEII